MQQSPSARSFARDSAISSVGLYIEFGVGFVTSAIVARALEPVAYGYYAFSIWLFGWLLLAANGPFAACIVKFGPGLASRHSPEHARSVVNFIRAAHRRWIIVLGLMAFVGLSVVPISGWESASFIMPFAALLTILCRSLYRIDVATAQSRGVFELEAIAQVVGSSVLICLTLVVATIMVAPESFVAVYCIVGVVLLVVSSVRVRPLVAPTLSYTFPNESSNDLRRYAVSVSVVTAIGLVSHRAIEVFSLQFFAEPIAVGHYSIALLFAKASVDTVLSSLMSTLTPRLASRTGSESLPDVASSVTGLVISFLLIGLAIAGSAVFFLPALILLMYGSQFAGAVMPSVSLVVIGAIAASLAPFSSLFMVQDKQNARIVLAIIPVLVSLLACLLLIPRFGVFGAVVSHGLAAASWAVAICVLVTRICGVRLPWTRAVRVFTAFLLAIALSTVVAGKAGVVRAAMVTAIFVALFALLAVVFRCIGTREFYVVREMFGTRSVFGAALGTLIDGVSAKFSWDTSVQRGSGG